MKEIQEMSEFELREVVKNLKSKPLKAKMVTSIRICRRWRAYKCDN